MEANYPYAIENQRGASKILPNGVILRSQAPSRKIWMLELALYGRRRAGLATDPTNERKASLELDQLEGRTLVQVDQQELFWYEAARHLLANSYFRHLQNKKYSKMPQQRERDRVSLIEFLYGTEENFLNTKIYPNITGTSHRPNCSGISRLNNSPSSQQQTAFVGFYGSGNHMLM